MGKKPRKKTRTAKGTAASGTTSDKMTASPSASAAPQPTTGTIFQQWAEQIRRILVEESQLVGGTIKHRTIRGNAREALIKGALQRILPSSYEIGTGEIIDAHGNRSSQMDIVIARREFPSLRFPDGSAQYLVESVLATIEVKSTLKSDTLKDALYNCHSLGRLRPSSDPASLVKIVQDLNRASAVKYQLFPDGRVQEQQPDGTWATPPSPILQKLMIGARPESYIFSFEGYKEDLGAFRSSIMEWLDDVQEKRLPLALANLPTLIASGGCVAARNQDMHGLDLQARTWPLMITFNEPNPLGRLVVRLLRKLLRTMPMVATVDGYCPSLEPYLTVESSMRGTVLGEVAF